MNVSTNNKNAVSVKNASKHFGSGNEVVKALDGVSVDISDNEFFTLLGPSGCGKTTLLRLIAGFELTTAGEIFLYDEEIEDLPPHKRSINTVFQHYALFPHMTVEENVGFGLRMLNRDPEEIKRRSMETLRLVKMDQFANRKPVQLSGGQQQRVALARALAPEPKVLLLDEPLSALDLKLRQAMRMELKNLQRETGITFIFVTHDQEEALTMSDRIAVMSAGKVQQVGGPLDIYERPLNRFVADFIGDSNFIDAKIISIDGQNATCALTDSVSVITSIVGTPQKNSVVTLAIRPEKITLNNDSSLRGSIQETVYLGTDTNYIIALENSTSVIVRDQNGVSGEARFSKGETISLHIPDGAIRMLAD